MQKITDAGWKFDNSYATLPESFFAKLSPTPVRSPKMAMLNRPLAESLGLDAEALQGEDGVAALAGNKVPEGALSLAQAYAGHQYGYFTMLGDGRAILLGEQITPSGERVDIQLKGAGRTPYSRSGDGRAALGPMLREYLISEAMHALGIPTTRSLAVVSTGQPVIREQDLPGAILTRVAASHIRVGTFQYARQRGIDDLRALADYTIQRHYPEAGKEEHRYLALLKMVIERQAGLIAQWQLVGFVHGVMNTDNMTLSGETIDYGPCAFMDTYEPATVFSSIDRHGRYAYGNQPKIAAWNLARLAESLLPLLDNDEEKAVKAAEDAIEGFAEAFHRKWLAGMRSKLGLFHEEPEDETLITDLLSLMKEHQADYTNTFVVLTLGKMKGEGLFGTEDFSHWRERWEARIGRQPEDEAARQQLMRNSNPAVIPRNHRVEEALAAAEKQGDYSLMERLLQVLSHPYAHSPEQAEYAELPPESNCAYRTFCGT
ncbi:YdiU family protein [Paenibacillus sp. FSL R5-0407]|uniref:protein adenylyltransferase SelO n=1 Tax=Paenibacillus sp. FSL R5-0407 TaxID=2975320 RepID=UPI0030FAFF0A